MSKPGASLTRRVGTVSVEALTVALPAGLLYGILVGSTMTVLPAGWALVVVPSLFSGIVVFALPRSISRVWRSVLGIMMALLVASEVLFLMALFLAAISGVS